jgi:hypothetical protein
MAVSRVPPELSAAAASLRYAGCSYSVRGSGLVGGFARLFWPVCSPFFQLMTAKFFSLFLQKPSNHDYKNLLFSKFSNL